jgi:hypothetical protein
MTTASPHNPPAPPLPPKVTYGAYTDATPIYPGYINISSTGDGGVSFNVRSDGAKSEASFDMNKAAAIQLLSTTLAALKA